MRYRTRTAYVDAVAFNPDRELLPPDDPRWPAGVQPLHPEHESGSIHGMLYTDAQAWIVAPGDYVVTPNEGEPFVLSPARFAARYEPAVERHREAWTATLPDGRVLSGDHAGAHTEAPAGVGA